MRGAKANIGSLSSMASKVRQEKKKSASAKAKAPLARAREANKPFKGANKPVDSSSDSDSDSDSSAASASGSDSDDDLDAARAKFLAGKAAKQKKAAETKVNGLKPASTPAKPLPKGTIPPSAQKPAGESSSGSDSESDEPSSDGSSSSRPPVIDQSKSVVKKQKSNNSSDSTSSSDSSSESEGPNTGNKALENKSSSSESSEDSSSDSDDEGRPSTSAETAVKGSTQNLANTAQSSSSEESDSDDESDGDKMDVDTSSKDNVPIEPMSQVSRAPWLNNSDFMLRKASSGNPGKEVADFFSNANLEGKQVWYFTAPASLPITVLKDMEIDLSKATKGEALLSHNGDNYGLDLESYATNTQIQLLIPSGSGDKYTSLNRGIDSTVHLRRMAKFGPGGEVHATATDNYVPVPKPIRQQPEGLRVRYTPIGVPTPAIPNIVPTKTTPAKVSGSQAKKNPYVQSSSSSDSESESGSDVEMTTPSASTKPASQSKPTKSGLANGDRKRKHSGADDQSAKRVKAEQITERSSAKKQATIQAPNPSATPSKKSSKGKEKKDKVKQEKTPKSTAMTPTTARQTPIPLPNVPGMRR
ncbi:DNA-directed RNA polymerase I subunit RPA34.5-domain-containing protein [Xylaria bambusicola]|uniref:DNA-directed RNA polymerase I subunit RPA34.5-domain-containing protein n=1 Tax=Xylaria bambusicola TaxID=326684 RepID=UPI002007B448|nr:DNA-directed RNA polymerase I subunit RPA34.5-domain-containing protein [Xylaria bambusicola]KAI0517063.1 DNA-directed RNA polymerase I subunit RPA34.5-domain-containing protein [Xylaria bambusicola]